MDYKQYQQDFLWFSYFGITQSDAEADPNAALQICIRRAFRDVCRTLDYTYSDSKLRSQTEEVRTSFADLKDKFKNSQEGMPAYLEERIKALLKTDAYHSETGFEEWHENTCKTIIEKADKYTTEDGKTALFKKQSFKYGHAQKWVNMSLKNMLVMNVAKWKMSLIMPYIHIPIDTYILSAASVEWGKPIWGEDGAKGLGIHSRLSNSWSHMDDKEYKEYQQSVRNETKKQNLLPIEWEGTSWIAQAKRESEKLRK